MSEYFRRFQYQNKRELQVLQYLQVAQSYFCYFVHYFSPQVLVCAVALLKLLASTAFPTKIPIFSGCWLLKKLWLEVEVPYLPVLQLLQWAHSKCYG